MLDRLGDQCNTAQVEQLQRAIGLMNLIARVAHAVDVLLVGNKRLQPIDRVSQRSSNLVDDPSQRRDVRRGSHQLIRIVFFRHGFYPTRKRATEAFNSRASVASCPIDCAACRVPCDVCSVTVKMRSIEWATPPADCA